MRLIQLMQLMFLILIGSSSTVKDVFIDPLDNPFYDTYIENTLRMKVQDILLIPKLNDSDFLKLLAEEISDDFIFSKESSSTTELVPFDRLLDDELIYRSAIDEKWENLMVSGPMVVTYYGNLLTLASIKDYSLRGNNNQPFRFIRYPDSMRTTLAQLGTEMYNALMSAHTGMYEIQLRVQMVPNHVKTTLRIITSASDAMLKSMLPSTLDKIESSALYCSNIANATLNSFANIKDFISELIEVGTYTQSNHEQDIKLIRELKQNTTFEQQRVADDLNLARSRYEESKKTLEEARQIYIKSMESLGESKDPAIVSHQEDPNFLSILVTAVINPLQGLNCLLGGCKTVTYTVDNTKFENAMAIVKAAQEDLNNAEKKHQEQYQQLLLQQNQLARTISDMAKLDLNQMNSEEVINLLKESMKRINEIEKQWVDMVEFFNILAIRASVARHVAVDNFVHVISKAQADNVLVNPLDREFFLEMIMPTVTDIESNSQLLYTLAGTYYMVSSKYMINQIAGIRANLVLTTNEERTAFLQESFNRTLITSAEVSAFAGARHAAYINDLHHRQETYTNYMNKLMVQELTGSLGR